MKQYLKKLKIAVLLAICAVTLLPTVGCAAPRQIPFSVQDSNGDLVAHILVPKSPKKVALAVGTVGLATLGYIANYAATAALLNGIQLKIKGYAEKLFGVNPKDYYENWTEKAAKLPGDELMPSQKKVLEQLLSTIKGEKNPHAVITGAAGSGKSSVIYSLAEAIAKNDTKIQGTDFEGAQVWCINAQKMNNAGIVGELAKRLYAVLDAAESHHKATGKRVILYIDEFHQAVQLGNHKDSQAENIVEILKTQTGNERNYRGFHILGATTTKEYEEFMQKIGRGAAIRRFPSLGLGEPTDQETVTILKRDALRLQAEEHVFIPQKSLTPICLQCVDRAKSIEGANPDKSQKVFADLVKRFARHFRHSSPENVLNSSIVYFEELHRELVYKQEQDSSLLNCVRTFFSPYQSTSEADKNFLDGVTALVEKINFRAAQNQSVEESKEELEKELISIDEKEELGQRRYLRSTISQLLRGLVIKMKCELQEATEDTNAISTQAAKGVQIVREIDRLSKAQRAGSKYYFPGSSAAKWSYWSPRSWGRKAIQAAALSGKKIVAWSRKKPIGVAIQELERKKENQMQQLIQENSSARMSPIITKEFVDSVLINKGQGGIEQSQEPNRVPVVAGILKRRLLAPSDMKRLSANRQPHPPANPQPQPRQVRALERSISVPLLSAHAEARWPLLASLLE